MGRSRCSSTSQGDDGDDTSSTSTGSETADTSSCASESLSSLSSSPSSSSNEAGGKSGKDDCDALAVECMERDQRLRRLLSQRKVGDTVALDDGKNMEPFTLRKGALDADDGVLLSTFSNALLFERLLSVLCSHENLAQSQNIDDIFSAANPIFHRNFKVPPADVQAEAVRSSAAVHWECAALDRGGIVVHRRKRERPTSGDAAAAPKTAHRRRAADARPCGGSATSGIIANSLQSWEEHLSSQLQAEGVSLESFRQQRQGSSHLEEMRFLQQSQWAEYQRELQLEEKRREQEAKRSIRRGENNTQ